MSEQVESEQDLFNEWLSTGTLRREEVHLIADQEAADQVEALNAEYEKALDEEQTGERTLDEKIKLPQIERELLALLERVNKSTSVWSIVRLEEPQRIQVHEETADSPRPRSLGRGATEKRKQEWEKELAAWQQECQENLRVRNLLALAYAVEWVEIGGKRLERMLDADRKVVKPAVTREMLEGMFAAPYGPSWQARLNEALNVVSTERVSLEVPSLRDDSTSDQI